MFDLKKTIDALLPKVSRPSRYVGKEINSIEKNLSKVHTRVALIFPDTYEVGVSHLGLKILYHILNNMEYVAAERVFAPWIDMEKELATRGIPLVSLESSLPLKDFDILGFTIPYELCYTNILTILSLSGIPFRSSQREEGYPLIIGGGSAVSNPEPIADFFDAFFIGDGEDGIVEIVNTYNHWKKQGGSRDKLLEELSRIEGMYIPSFYKVKYRGSGSIEAISGINGHAPGMVKRRIVEDLDRVPYPVSPPVPYMQVIHDRLTIEIARGCTHGCRFCQAGITYRPVRERSPERILKIVDESLRNTGYEEISLASLSTGDYACLGGLLTVLNTKYADKYINFSLPSLRIGTLTPEIIEEVCKSRNISFTIAPEAGTDRLRKVINKEMDENIFENSVENLFSRGVKSLKMYFMIGLPSEEEKDLEGIIRLAKKCRNIGQKYGKRRKDITVSISTFVPKPHTPFQWYGMEEIETVKKRIEYLRKVLRKIGINFKWHRTDMSYLESIFSRGDRRLSRVIEMAWKYGCRFDSWTEIFSIENWEKAFKECGIDPDYYAHRDISLDETLPWEHIATGVTKEFLAKEYKRALSGKTIPDCKYGVCPNCGVCDMEAVRGLKQEGIRPIARKSMGTTTMYQKTKEITEIMRPVRLRIRYTKTGDIRMLSQLEIMTTFIRSLRRADIPIIYSEGFHPHPRISFGPALPVGVESVCEYMDIELKKPLNLLWLKEHLNKFLPEGLKVLNITGILAGAPSLSSVIKLYGYEIRFARPEDVEKDRINALSEVKELWVQREITKDGKKKVREINVVPFIKDIKWIRGDILYILLKSRDGECCRPSDVVSALFNIPPYHTGVRIIRTGLYGKYGGTILPPEKIQRDISEKKRIFL